jgi:hypothetical protein
MEKWHLSLNNARTPEKRTGNHEIAQLTIAWFE